MLHTLESQQLKPVGAQGQKLGNILLCSKFVLPTLPSYRELSPRKGKKDRSNKSEKS